MPAAGLLIVALVYGGIAFMGFVSWRLYGVIIHGEAFLPHPSFERKHPMPQMETQVLAQEAANIALSKGYNLKELEGQENRHVWDIALLGMVHHLYMVYHAYENQTIARDRYIKNGWFTNTEYEYLIGPEKDGKQSSPGILRQAGLVKTIREGGQPAQNILTIDDPIKAIAALFAWLEEKEANADMDGRIADIGGVSYLLPEEKEDLIFDEDGVPY